MRSDTEKLIRQFLRQYTRPQVPAGAVVLVFAGDNYNRMAAAAELQPFSPRSFVLTGRPFEVDSLRQLARSHGISDSRLIEERTATNTITNARNCASLLRNWRGPVVLVTDDWHMPRSLWLCNWFGLWPIPWCATGTVSEDHILREARTWAENMQTVMAEWPGGATW